MQNRFEHAAGSSPDASVRWLYGDPGLYQSLLVLALLTAALLAPFAGKAFHIDDPVFLRIARQVIDHPLDPYGGRINWGGLDLPMSKSMDNPPLAAYYTAAIASRFGWSEIALHIAFMPFSIALVLGTFFLARRCEAPPVLAALASLCSPAFLVSSTNIMSDTMMAALYVWSLGLWMDGIQRRSYVRLFTASLLVTFAALTKYYAMTAIPLMVVYAAAKRPRDLLPILFLALPPAVMFGYEYWTTTLYGHGMLSSAADAASRLRWTSDQQAWAKCFTGLSFTGAVVPCAFFLAPRLFSRRLLTGGAIIAVIAALLVIWGSSPSDLLHAPLRVRTVLVVELVFLISSGLVTLGLGAAVWRSTRAPETMLLALWVTGTFVYSSFVNWTINEPPLMLLGPPAAILMARACALQGALPVRWIAVSLAAAGVLGVSVCWGDYHFANAGRTAAKRVMSLPRAETAAVWFQGHWGFQYYMEKLGAQAVDRESSTPATGDVIVLPYNNTNVFGIQKEFAASWEVIELPASTWVTTVHPVLKAGFYCHYWGPVPFVFGSIPLERYNIVTYRAPLTE